MQKNHNIYDANGVYKEAGDAISFKNASQSGYHENHHGVGETSIGAQRMDPVTGEFVTMFDMIQIHYTNANEEQRLNASTLPSSDREWMHASNIGRRMSRTQANYVAAIIQEALGERLQGVIPSDRVLEEMESINRRYRVGLKAAKIMAERALEDDARNERYSQEWIEYYDRILSELSQPKARKSVLGEGAEQIAQARKANPEDFEKVNGTPRYIPAIDGAPQGAEDCPQWASDPARRHMTPTPSWLRNVETASAPKNNPDISKAC